MIGWYERQRWQSLQVKHVVRPHRPNQRQRPLPRIGLRMFCRRGKGDPTAVSSDSRQAKGINHLVSKYPKGPPLRRVPNWIQTQPYMALCFLQIFRLLGGVLGSRGQCPRSQRKDSPSSTYDDLFLRLGPDRVYPWGMTSSDGDEKVALFARPGLVVAGPSVARYRWHRGQRRDSSR